MLKLDPLNMLSGEQLKTSLCLVLGLIISVIAGCGNSPQVDHPNLLIVTIDTCRRDRLGCYGSKANLTPVIDDLASRGTVFTRAVAHSPLTLPSHASILTGEPPWSHGIRDNGTFRLSDEQTTLAEICLREGYRTGAVVGAFVLDSQFGLDQGFEFFDDRFQEERKTSPFLFTERRAEEVTAVALDWLNQKDDRPFFLWVHYYDPHYDYSPPDPYQKLSPDPYSAEIAYVDQSLKRLLDTVHESKGEETIIALTSDHAESLGAHGEKTHGYYIYDATLRIPLILVAPGSNQAPEVAQTVYHIDLLPTLLSLAGLQPPNILKGRDLTPLMEGGNVPPAEGYAESYVPLAYGWSPLRSYRSSGWKLIEAPDTELYDMKSDPEETQDLALDHPEKVEELRSYLAGLRDESSATAESAQLTEEQRERLDALGYVQTGTSVPEGIDLPDPKEYIDVYVMFDKVRSNIGQKRWEDATQLLYEILQRDPEIPEAYRRLAMIADERGLYEESIRHLRKVLQLQPEDATSMVSLGLNLQRLGQYDESTEILEAARERAPFRADVHANLGTNWLSKGRVDRAIFHYRTALERDPDEAKHHYNLGVAFFTKGLTEKALERFEKAVEIKSDFLEAQANLALALLQTDQIEEARELLTQLVSEHPDEAKIRLASGYFFAKQGDVERARQEWNIVMRLSPGNPEAARLLQTYSTKSAETDPRESSSPDQP